MNDRIAESADRLGLPAEAIAAAYEARDAALAGPWEAHSGEDHTVVMLQGEVTDTASIRIYGEHAEAIASVVAAAPELLAALKRIVSIKGSTRGPQKVVDELHFIAEQAIAKVEDLK